MAYLGMKILCPMFAGGLWGQLGGAGYVVEQEALLARPRSQDNTKLSGEQNQYRRY